jgi:hypothetical protein
MAKGNRFFWLVAVTALLALSLAGCRKTISVQNQSSPMPVLTQVSDNDIEQAIIRGGARTNWEIVPAGARTMIGTLYIRSHQAVVTITYDKAQYRIQYKSSMNLQYEDGKIHPNYNNWVNLLDNNLRQELAALTR